MGIYEDIFGSKSSNESGRGYSTVGSGKKRRVYPTPTGAPPTTRNSIFSTNVTRDALDGLRRPPGTSLPLSPGASDAAHMDPRYKAPLITDPVRKTPTITSLGASPVGGSASGDARNMVVHDPNILKDAIANLPFDIKGLYDKLLEQTRTGDAATLAEMDSLRGKVDKNYGDLLAEAMRQQTAAGAQLDQSAAGLGLGAGANSAYTQAAQKLNDYTGQNRETDLAFFDKMKALRGTEDTNWLQALMRESTEQQANQQQYLAEIQAQKDANAIAAAAALGSRSGGGGGRGGSGGGGSSGSSKTTLTDTLTNSEDQNYDETASETNTLISPANQAIYLNLMKTNPAAAAQYLHNVNTAEGNPTTALTQKQLDDLESSYQSNPFTIAKKANTKPSNLSGIGYSSAPNASTKYARDRGILQQVLDASYGGGSSITGTARGKQETGKKGSKGSNQKKSNVVKTVTKPATS